MLWRRSTWRPDRCCRILLADLLLIVIGMKIFFQFASLLILSEFMLACSSVGVNPDQAAESGAVSADATEPVAQYSGDAASVRFLNRVLQNNPDWFSAANRQIVLVQNATAEAVPVVIRAFEKHDGAWRAEFPDMDGSGAKNGFAPYDMKTEGDGRAPTGIFDLVATFGYHETAQTLMPYKQSTDRDFWIDGVSSENYNKWLSLPEGIRPGVSHERLRRDDHLYEYLIVVDYNSNPVVKNKGSAIFMHVERAPGVATVGCIATSVENMQALFDWLDPAKSPIIIMGTESDLTSANLVRHTSAAF